VTKALQAALKRAAASEKPDVICAWFAPGETQIMYRRELGDVRVYADRIALCWRASGRDVVAEFLFSR